MHTRLKPSAASRAGFTLIELLIVIGLLAALATLVLSNLTFTRTEALDDSLVQKELSDIQRAFQRFEADCVPRQDDYKLIAKYGLAPLMEYDEYLTGTGDEWTFPEEWDNERRRGWRGPYIQDGQHSIFEGEEEINTSTIKINTSINYSDPTTFGQPPLSSGTPVPVIFTPYSHDKHNQDSNPEDLWQFEHGDFYRVIPEMAGSDIEKLWVVFPSHSGALVLAAPTAEDPSGVRALLRRRLTLDD